GVWRRVAEEAIVLIEPRREDREILVEDAARARQDRLAPPRRERAPRGRVAQGARRNRRVVVIRPERFDELGRRDDPADTQPRQAVGFREPARYDHTLA